MFDAIPIRKAIGNRIDERIPPDEKDDEQHRYDRQIREYRIGVELFFLQGPFLLRSSPNDLTKRVMTNFVDLDVLSSRF